MYVIYIMSRVARVPCTSTVAFSVILFILKAAIFNLWFLAFLLFKLIATTSWPYKSVVAH